MFLPPLAMLPAVKASLNELLTQIAIFFTKAGAFVFGSGLAIVPFLYGGVVKEYGWLNDQEFLDAVAVAMITPGPVVITVGFIGYIVTGRGRRLLDGLRRGFRRGPGHISSLLSVHDHSGSLLQKARQTTGDRRLCRWRDGRRRGSHRRSLRRARPAHDLRERLDARNPQDRAVARHDWPVAASSRNCPSRSSSSARP